MYALGTPPNGSGDYPAMSRQDKFRIQLQEKNAAAQWYQDNFREAKYLLTPLWDKLNNRDLEDAITGIVTDTHEDMKTMAMFWVFYANANPNMAGKMLRLLWHRPDKYVYYQFGNATQDNNEQYITWVLKMETVPQRPGKHPTSNHTTEYTPKPVYQYVLTKGTVDVVREIETNNLRLAFVNRPLVAASKHSAAEWTEKAQLVGVHPGPVSKLDTTGHMLLDLDLEKCVQLTEVEMGILKKQSAADAEKKRSKVKERFTKAQWYDTLYDYCLAAMSPLPSPSRTAQY
jgi:hypothetical protein